MSDTEHDETTDFTQALAEGWLPIREVAKRTGVNPVTLRAWERRYGLIVPKRTPKGHRLYSSEHIARIQSILAWLNRGVSVGQVKRLLDDGSAGSRTLESDWGTLLSEFIAATEKLSERRLEDLFNRATRLYPPVTLYQRLLSPLLRRLDERWKTQPGATLERVFFLGWLRTKLGSRLYTQDRETKKPPVLICNVGSLPMEPGVWLSAWLAANNGLSSEILEWPMPVTDLMLAIERLSPSAVLLYSSQALDAGQLERTLPRTAAICPVPLVLAGAVTHIYRSELLEVPKLLLASDPVEALACLQSNAIQN
ncbi:MerR family transcriptional regulator [Pseudomonas matsuisoli]|uniref:MerR family transcriptional regulator n=1 Tax=Pseudomonas matsuisoli TaxID=1515666 RepID=A0A917Q290_9PSED|nr:MerR family transcriptional regulator [Pseudomonas matsuisoli]GGK07486.1 MerR family transcriptional regulator [Pseudomonas matsuisoli]